MIPADIKEGDIIFTAIPHLLYKKVAEGTGSKSSHVGIILKDSAGQWVVAESAVPVSTYCPLNKFINRSENGWCRIRRLKENLTEEQIASIKHEAEKRMGMFYHLGFKYESNRLFCSKFVYEVFDAALGIEVGQLETFRELINKLPDTPLWFWRIWYFGFIPWKRITVTPASQMNADNLFTVYDGNLTTET